MRIARTRAIVLFALAVLLAAGLLARSQLAPRANIGAGFVAKLMCSCIFVGGRDEAACRLDLRSDLEPVRSEALPDGVHAWVPLLASRTARFREGTGCTLE